MKWVEKSLNELGSVSRGRSRHRPRDAEHLYGGPYPFVQTGDIKHAGLYLTRYDQTYNEAGLAQSKLWSAGTLCITIAANIAETSILGIDACFPDSVIGFIANKHKADARFVKYMFDARLKKRYQTFSQGVAQDNLSQEKLLSIKFPMPSDVAEQIQIADLLSAYDEQIANNTRRVELLEQSARLLFKEWFVHLRYPGNEHDKISKGVPEGWSRPSFSELAEFINGFAFKPNDWDDIGLPIIKIPELKEGVGLKTPRYSGSEVPEKYKVHCGDLLFSWSGTLAVEFWVEEEAYLNQHLFLVKPHGRPGSAFLLLALRENMRDFINLSVGATMKHIRRGALDQSRVMLPPERLLFEFEAVVDDFYSMIISLRRRNVRLSQARDLLLPRLMDRQISI